MSGSKIHYNLDLDRFHEPQILISNEKMQKAIVNIFNVDTNRGKI